MEMVNNRFARRSKIMYDRKAPKYDRTLDGKFTARYKREMLKRLTVKDGEKVLDVGCGNGVLINGIACKAKVRAHGVDISPGMIDECKKRAPHIDFRVSEAETLPFSDNEFDVVTMCCVLHHINEPEKFFSEVRRVLKPGGRLVIGDPWFPTPIKQFVEYVVFPIHNAGDKQIFTHSEMKNLFEQGGFSVTEVYSKGFVHILTGQANKGA